MTDLLPALAIVFAILVLACAAAAFAVAALFPGGRGFRAERAGWSFAVALGTIALAVPLSFAAGSRPGWFPWACLSLVLAIAGWWKRWPAALLPTGERGLTGWAWLWLFLIALGVLAYALRALSEPMWSNDFLQTWGLKGKMIFAEGGLSARLLSAPELDFAHRDYPLGLPFLYAGLASLLGRWDDHAMALMFPALQVATLLVLGGWLQRRGAGPAAVGAATALLALFEPLYAAYLTGYAEVPLAFFALLLATSLSDAVDRTDAGALRRIAVAAGLCVATKNEGLYFVLASVAIGAVGIRRRGHSPAGLVAALLVPAAVLLLVPRLAWGGAPLTDFDFGLIRPSQWPTLADRFRVTGIYLTKELLGPGVPMMLAALLGLFAAGRRTPWADRPLLLALCAELVYLILPAFAVYPGAPELGPAWLVTTALGRTSAALAPLLAAGLAGRFGRLPAAERLGAVPVSS